MPYRFPLKSYKGNFTLERQGVIFMQEIWKDVDGYIGFYKISNLGRLKSLYRKDEIIIKPHIYKNGYCRVRLWNRDTRKFKDTYIHRLVAKAFLENPNNLPEINHKDENKQNNQTDNLEWCDRKYNCNYGNIKIKLAKNKEKKVSQYTMNGEFVSTYRSMKQIYRLYGYDCSAIRRCCQGKQRKGYGYIWKFV